MNPELVDAPLSSEKSVHSNWRIVGLARGILCILLMISTINMTVPDLINSPTFESESSAMMLGRVLGMLLFIWWGIHFIMLANYEIHLSPKLFNYRKSRWLNLILLLLVVGGSFYNSIGSFPFVLQRLQNQGISFGSIVFLSTILLGPLLIVADIYFLSTKKSKARSDDDAH